MMEDKEQGDNLQGCGVIEWIEDQQLIRKVQEYLQVVDIREHSAETIGRECLKNMSISDGEWTKRNMRIITKIISKWHNLLKLDLSNNFEMDILIEIQNIRFPDLLKLDLKRNSIKSLQQFSLIYFPKLKSLNFSQNNITEIKSLRKFIIQNDLIEISLHGNFIIQMDPVCEMSLMNLKGLTLEYYFNQFFLDKMSWTVRIESRKLQLVSLWLIKQDLNTSKSSETRKQWRSCRSQGRNSGQVQTEQIEDILIAYHIQQISINKKQSSQILRAKLYEQKDDNKSFQIFSLMSFWLAADWFSPLLRQIYHFESHSRPRFLNPKIMYGKIKLKSKNQKKASIKS